MYIFKIYYIVKYFLYKNWKTHITFKTYDVFFILI